MQGGKRRSVWEKRNWFGMRVWGVGQTVEVFDTSVQLWLEAVVTEILDGCMLVIEYEMPDGTELTNQFSVNSRMLRSPLGPGHRNDPLDPKDSSKKASPKLTDDPAAEESIKELVAESTTEADSLVPGEDNCDVWRIRKWLESVDLAKILAEALAEPLGTNQSGYTLDKSVAAKDAAKELSFARGLAKHERKGNLIFSMLRRQFVLEKISKKLYDDLEPFREDAAADAGEYNSKFEGFQLAYAGLDKFHRGLDEVIGMPRNDVFNAMQEEHVAMPDSRVVFTTSNYNMDTTSEYEWWFVVDPCNALKNLDISDWPAECETRLTKAHHRKPLSRKELEALLAQINEKLEKENLPLLTIEELIGLRLYTGPLFMKYNGALRGLGTGIDWMKKQWESSCLGNKYATTVHVINSGLLKLSTLTKAEKVYRGMSGGKLPDRFKQIDEYGVRGGVELAFMSTTTNREVAMHYAAGGGGSAKKAGIVLELQQGLTDRGADLGDISMYPHEREICFPPLCGIHLIDTIVRGNVLVACTRVTVNFKAQTIDKVLGQRKQVLLNMIAAEDKMMNTWVADMTQKNDASNKSVDNERLEPLAPMLETISTTLAKREPEEFNAGDLLQDSICVLASGGSWLKTKQARCVFDLIGVYKDNYVTDWKLSNFHLGSTAICVLAAWLRKLSDTNGFKIEQLLLRGNDANSFLEILADTLQNCPSLKILDMSRNEIKKNGIKALAASLQYCSSLEELILDDNAMGEAGVHEIATVLPHCASLTRLEVAENRIANGGANRLAAALPQCPRLQILGVRENAICDIGCESLSTALAQCRSLTKLDFSFNKLGPLGCEFLASAVPSCSYLKVLDLEKTEAGAEGAQHFAAAIPKIASLERFCFDSNQIGDDGIISLAEGLPKCGKLQLLSLSDNEIDDAGTDALAKSIGSCASLTTLGFGQNYFGCTSAVKLMQQLPKLNKLSDLGIENNCFGDEEAFLASMAKSLPKVASLTKLSIGTDALGSEGAKTLAGMLKNLKRLTYLDVSSNGFMLDGIIPFVKALPSCNTLQTLCLEDDNLCDKSAAALAGVLPKCLALRVLDLSLNDMTAVGAAALAKALPSCKALEELDFSKNSSVEDDGIGSLAAAFPRCQALKKVNLGFTKMGPEGIARLSSSLAACEGMEQVSIKGNSIGNAGAASLASALPKCPLLNRIEISQCEITEDGYGTLADALQHCRRMKQVVLERAFCSDGALAKLQESLPLCYFGDEEM